LIRKIIILLLISYPITLTSAQNEIEISKCGISELSTSDYSLNYTIKNTFNYDSDSKLQVQIPFEKFIIQGPIANGIINEKDFLFSQLDVDLNNDSDINDSFKINIAGKKPAIDNKQISLLYKSTSNYHVLVPFNDSGNINLNRITKNGIPFTLRNFSSNPPEIIIGLNTVDEIDFKKFNNSLLLIEIITSDKSAGDSLLIDGEKTFIGRTNEKDLTGGENSYRYISTKNIIINDNISNGAIKINKISRPFILRLTYYFAVSENLILMNQKIIRKN